MLSAHKTADYIIASAHACGEPISNLKLQKLLYYSQAWHLALYGDPLFEEQIEAWVHGPVVPCVYRSFRDWAWKPITYHPESGQTDGVDSHDKKHLDAVLEAYGGMSAFDLERLTHSESPWINARRGLPPDEPSTEVITWDDMRNYYRSAANEDQAR